RTQNPGPMSEVRVMETSLYSRVSSLDYDHDNELRITSTKPEVRSPMSAYLAGGLPPGLDHCPAATELAARKRNTAMSPTAWMNQAQPRPFGSMRLLAMRHPRNPVSTRVGKTARGTPPA